MKVGDKVRFVETDGKHTKNVGRRAVIINADNEPSGHHAHIRVKWLDNKIPPHEYDEFFSNRFVLDE